MPPKTDGRSCFPSQKVALSVGGGKRDRHTGGPGSAPDPHTGPEAEASRFLRCHPQRLPWCHRSREYCTQASGAFPGLCRPAEVSELQERGEEKERQGRGEGGREQRKETGGKRRKRERRQEIRGEEKADVQSCGL